MKNKVLIGGVIALVIVSLIGFFCFRVGKNFVDNFNTPDGTDTTKPAPPPPTSKLPAQPTTPEEAQKIYLALGNPSNATADASNANNYLMVNNFYALSYNREKGIPNWAAWRVTRADMGDLERNDSFRPDDRLPAGWTRVTPSDYTGSGFDRGHVVPNADRDGSKDAMASTFLMTNMMPQTPDLNRGPWAKLEGYLRTLVTRGSDVYVFAGAYGENGKLKKKVTIPEYNWKIAVAVPAGSDVSAVNENARVIAVDMPNVKGIKNVDWQIYHMTVRDIEQKTGYNFFSNLPQNLQDALEAKKDNIND